MKTIGGYQNTRINGEDFAITPYLFGVYVNLTIKIFGIGLCWGHHSVYIGLGFNVPKNYPIFTLDKFNNTK